MFFFNCFNCQRYFSYGCNSTRYTHSMSLSNLNTANNGQKYLSDKNIIDDNVNYLEKNFRSLLPTFNSINNTNQIESQKQIEQVNPYSNTDNLNYLLVELLNHKLWDIVNTTFINVISLIYTFFGRKTGLNFVIQGLICLLDILIH